MKQTFTLVVTCFAWTFVYGQKYSTYLVEYHFKQRTMLPDSVKNQKIEGTVEYTDTNNIKRTIKSPVSLDLQDFEFETHYSIVANRDSSKIYFANIDSKDGESAVSVNTPDTLFYSKGNWTKLYEGIYEPIQLKSFSFHETKQTKKILGYDCIKFVSTNGELTIWASKALPNTLLPYPGLEKFKYGILELFDSTYKGHTRALKITRQ